MVVTRIHESPRVTKPYTEPQWAKVLAWRGRGPRAAGGRRAPDHGGEPTFVAVADRDAAEWNIDAMGPSKRSYAVDLVHKLRDEYGRAASCTSARASGIRASSCRAGRCRLLARRRQAHMTTPAVRRRTPGRALHQRGRGRFTQALAQRLGLADRFIQPGYEDVFYYLWRNAGCRSTWIRSMPGSTTRWNGFGCAGCSTAGSIA